MTTLSGSVGIERRKDVSDGFVVCDVGGNVQMIDTPPSLADVAAASPDLMMSLTSDGSFIWNSPRWEAALGWSAHELRSMSLFSLVHPSDTDEFQRYLAAVNNGESRPVTLARIRAEDGSWRRYEWSFARNANDQLFGIGRDGTANVGQEILGGRHEQLLRMAERLAINAQWFAEFSSGYVFWSEEVFRIHGLVPSEYVPTLDTAIDAYHPDDRAAVRRHIDRAVQDQEPFDFELRIVRPDGEVRMVRSLGQPEVDPVTNKVIGIFGVIQDITEDRRSQRLAEMELFSYGAAHDLRQPIRHISGMMHILSRDLTLTQSQQVLWDYMDTALGQMDTLVHELLSFGDARSDRPHATVQLGDVLAEVELLLAGEFEESGAELVYADLPAVDGDAARLRRVFQNIISNAIKYRSTDRQLRIEVTGRVEGPWCLIDVADNGMGFPNAAAKRLFDPFSRESRASDGVGLGLAIVRRIVDQMGGSVSASGEEGVGAVFSLKLRASQTAETASA